MQSTIYFGAPNSKSLKVSDSLLRRGIQLLRSSPSEFDIEGHRDFPQHGYDFYAANLPVFIKSRVTGKQVYLLSEGFDCVTPAEESLPFPIPDIILRWNLPVAAEVVDGIKARLQFQDITIVAAKGPALLVKPKSISDLRFIRECRPDPVCPAPDFSINPSAIPTYVNVVRLASMFVRTHTYPAVYDHTHTTNLMEVYNMSEEDVVMTDLGEGGEVGSNDVEKVRRFGGRNIPIPKEFSRVYIKMKDEIPNIDECYTSFITALPNSEGTWFPYITELAHWDKTTVIDVVEEYFFKILASTTVEQNVAFQTWKREWGVIAKTEVGKQLSHLYRGIKLAIRTQTRLVPFMPKDRYEGFVLSGGAYFLRVGKDIVRPVSYDMLKGGLVDSSLHSVTLRKIGNVLKMVEYDPDGMKDIAMDVRKASLTDEQRKTILDLAKGLSFEGNHYGINQTSFNMIANLIINAKTLDHFPEDFPIHPSLLFDNNIAHLAWGAFGDMAPSFRVPGGDKMSLEKNWRENVKVSGKEVSRNVTRISCRNVLLEKALEDLDLMMKDKCVLNPLKREGVRRGQFNMDRFFTGQEFVNVVTSLRMISSAVVIGDSSIGKRKAGDDLVDERPAKKSAFDDF